MSGSGARCESSSSTERGVRLPAPHAIGLRIESFTDQPVTVHVTLRDTVTRLPHDSTTRSVEPTILRTPVHLDVDAGIRQVEIVTEGNRAVRVTFDTGPSAVERAQRVWEREIVLRRSIDGDLVPRAQTVQLLPAR